MTFGHMLFVYSLRSQGIPSCLGHKAFPRASVTRHSLVPRSQGIRYAHKAFPSTSVTSDRGTRELAALANGGGGTQGGVVGISVKGQCAWWGNSVKGPIFLA